MAIYTVLADRYPFRRHLINLGDQALSEGCYELLGQEGKNEVRSGGWKNFPYFNFKSFRRALTTENHCAAVFDRWLTRVEGWAARPPSGLEDLLQHPKLAGNPLVEEVENRFRARYSRGPLETSLPYLLRPVYARRFLQAIEAADLVVFNGGGMLADHLAHYAPTYLFELYLCKKMHKPVYAVNYSVSIQQPLLKEAAGLVLRQVDGHLVRESFSRDYLLELGVDPASIAISPDFAFAAPQGDESATAADREDLAHPCAGVVIRGDRPVDYPFWERLIEYLAATRGLTVYFPHTCFAHDRQVVRRLARRLPVREFQELHPPGSLIPLLGRMRCLLTDRYHAAVFGAMASTPVLAFPATTHKLNGLCRLATEMDLPIRAGGTTPQEIFAQIDQFLDHPPPSPKQAARTILRQEIDRALQQVMGR